MAIMFALIGAMLSWFIKINDTQISNWLGGSSLPCVFSVVIISFLVGTKSIILSTGLKILEHRPRERKTFYNYFDNCIYVSLFIIIINILYLLTLGLGFFKEYFLNRIFIMLIITSTFYLITAMIRLLIILKNIQKVILKQPS